MRDVDQIYSYLKDVYIFDVDGTLTPPRQVIDEKFAKIFNRFCKNNSVYLATGSDYPKIQEQLNQDILSNCMGVFTCMGNQLWVNDEIIYSHKLNFPSPVIDWLHEQISSSKYPKDKRGTRHFEHRAGMLNFSIVGRDITTFERKEYHAWDTLHGERNRIVTTFNRLFEDYKLEAAVGGEISIDIQEIGKDKGQIYDYLSQYKTKIFFGDKCKPDGNDFSLYKKCEKKHFVKSWRDTMDIVNGF